MPEAGLHCATCQRQTLHRQQRPNHILHFLITFFTCGLWALVWLILGLSATPWRCTFCGTPQPEVYRTPPPGQPRVAADSAWPKVLMILAGVAGALVLLAGVGLFVGKRVADRREAENEAARQRWRDSQPAAPTPVPTPDARRFVFEQKEGDEDARRAMFRMHLEESHMDCSILGIAMESPGVWKVSCSGGKLYALTFQQDGRFRRAVKLR